MNYNYCNLRKEVYETARRTVVHSQFHIRNIQCTNNYCQCIVEVLLYTHYNFKKKFKSRRLIKIFGHSLFALCLCLFPLIARLFKTRASTNMNNLGAALHFCYGNSSSSGLSDGLNDS